MSNTVRPDNTIAVSRLAQFCSALKASHWVDSKRVVRYHKGTKQRIETYRTNGGSNLIGHVHSYFSVDNTDRKCTAGYVFKLVEGRVPWRLKKQTKVDLCTSKAEYVVLSTAAREAILVL